MAKQTLKAGDVVAYAAKFLRSTGQFTGAAPARRGVYVGPEPSMPTTYCRVRWDDIEAVIASGAGQYADPEYVDDARRNGSLVHVNNIAKVGSARFALNDL